MDISAISPTFWFILSISVIIACVFVINFNIRKSKDKSKNSHNTIDSNNVSQKSEGDNSFNFAGPVNAPVNVYQGVTQNSSKGADDEVFNFDINILFIDDEQISIEDFRLIKLLNKHGFRNTHKIFDADSLDQREIKDADIVFVDITGVGVVLECKDGSDLAARIKKTYPSKIVARYSSTEEHSIFVNDVELLDGKFGKNDDFQTYLDFIQQYSKKH